MLSIGPTPISRPVSMQAVIAAGLLRRALGTKSVSAIMSASLATFVTTWTQPSTSRSVMAVGGGGEAGLRRVVDV